MSNADIPVVILAGGRGARFDHESQVKPKPMIEVAGKPILQHIIDGFVAQGFREFIVATGYLGQSISDHFDFDGRSTILAIDWRVADGRAGESKNEYRGGMQEFYYDVDGDAPFTPVRVKVIGTGLDSHTGERLWRLRDVIGNSRFILTYGDGLSDVPMDDVLAQHGVTSACVTMTAVRPPGRFGVVEFQKLEYGHVIGDSTQYSPTIVTSFQEKADVGWINGGFMVCEPWFIDRYLDSGNELESMALSKLANDGAIHYERGGLHAYKHEGYWRAMDSRRDLEQIESDVKLAGRLPWLR